MAGELPSGVVTFLMTDVVGSTAIWRDSPHAGAAMARQAEVIGAAIAKRGGVRPADQGEGDSTLSAFARPRDALAAALDAQRALAAELWPDGCAVRVRMALHSGDAELVGERNYGGLALIRCARLRALAGGGQVLVSSTTAALAGESLPDGASLVELETVTIADFAAPERVRQLCHPELAGGSAPLRGALNRLPVWPTPLVGRERERREVAERLAEARLVTITGAGGSGKTRLAHAVAEDLCDHFAEGVLWVELARLSDPEQVVASVLAACGEREIAGLLALDLLVRRLANEERLLVLDNCEHLLDACTELADALVRGAPRCRVLTTSREPLGVAGETSWRIPSLSLPATGERNLARLAESDAVQLFLARARAAVPELRLDERSAPVVARICRRLDGVPLALELAAARARSLSLERLADGLDDRFRLLTGGARTAVERQRTLLASVEWSHELLDEEERTLLRRLAVFATPFSLEAVEAIAADDDIDARSVLDLLARLVDKSLVVHADDRYRMLETIRQFAQARAADAGELELLRERHLTWFRTRARSWRLDREVASRPLVDEVGRLAADLVAAAEWSATNEQRLPAEVLHALAQLWQAREAFLEARTSGARLLAMLPAGSRAWLEGAAPLARILVSADEALTAPIETALGEFGDTLDPVARAFAEVGAVYLQADSGDRQALETLERAGEIANAAGNLYLELVAKLDLALAMLRLGGDASRARALAAWAQRSAPPDGWIRDCLDPCEELIALYEGDFARATRALSGNQAGRPRLDSIGHAAQTAFLQCDAEAMERAIVETERIGDLGSFAVICETLRGQLKLLKGDLRAAAAQLDSPGGYRYGASLHAYIGAIRAHLALSLGETADASARVAALRAQSANTVNHIAAARTELVAAHLARQLGDALQAESVARAALASSARQETPLPTTEALEMLALLAGDRGELDFAARLFGAAAAFRERSGFRWVDQHCREAFEALRVRLPEGALAEGARLSLYEAAAYAARGRGERGRPDHGWESLTPSEQRVAELVGEGLPNAAIAKKLFVSLATVKTHLVHVYGKLGLETRAELAAAVTARRLGN